MTRHQVSNRQRSNAKTMRREPTEAESRLWSELRAHRLMGLGFRRQLPIGPYTVDLACPEHRLIIELDGGGHADDTQTAYDAKRTAYLQRQGWTVLRFWNHEVTKNIEAACDQIIRTLQEKGAVFS